MKNRWEQQRLDLVDAVRRRGEVTDPRVLDALASVPRERFVPEEQRAAAYADRALPIGLGQTISQPSLVAYMTQAASPGPTDRVLEVGTGSGYQAALLGRLAGRVIGIERIRSLAERARDTLAELGMTDVEVRTGDGTGGWPEGAPYDAIVVTAGGPRVPRALLDQLAPGGRLVMPVGPRGAERLVRVLRTPDGDVTEELLAVSFVPLVGADGWPVGR